MTLSGYTITRNCISLDYCYELTIQSLLPVCDEVVVCDSDSTDGTRERLDVWAKEEPKLRVINYPWPGVNGRLGAISEWVNYARGFLNHPLQLHLEADEVFGDDVGSELRFICELNLTSRTNCGPFWFSRLNFIKDAHHLIPPGTVCGNRVVRYGPSNMWMPLDCPINGHSQEMFENAVSVNEHRLNIFHYGFIRRTQAYYDKCRVMQPLMLNDHDKRLDEAEQAGTPWIDKYPELTPDKLIPWKGQHPKIAHGWLAERGYQI